MPATFSPSHRHGGNDGPNGAASAYGGSSWPHNCRTRVAPPSTSTTQSTRTSGKLQPGHERHHRHGRSGRLAGNWLISYLYPTQTTPPPWILISWIDAAPVICTFCCNDGHQSLVQIMMFCVLSRSTILTRPLFILSSICFACSFPSLFSFLCRLTSCPRVHF